MSPFLVSAQWLFANLSDGAVKTVDASWYLPAMGRNAKAEFNAHHIPGAVFFDQDEIVDPASPLPHTVPDNKTFAAKAGALGLTEHDTIVVYDGMGLFSAPRVWWMLRAFGATKTVLLDGGLPAWLEANLPVESGGPSPVSTLFNPNLDKQKIAECKDVQAVLKHGTNIIDARPYGRFTGEEAEPRAGMRSGHMPGAVSVPASCLVKDGHLLPADELRHIFTKAGVDLDKPSITTCGSGVTAATVTLALESIGHTGSRLYDGSWSEWGGRDDTPVVTGP